MGAASARVKRTAGREGEETQFGAHVSNRGAGHTDLEVPSKSTGSTPGRTAAGEQGVALAPNTSVRKMDKRKATKPAPLAASASKRKRKRPQPKPTQSKKQCRACDGLHRAHTCGKARQSPPLLKEGQQESVVASTGELKPVKCAARLHQEISQGDGKETWTWTRCQEPGCLKWRRVPRGAAHAAHFTCAENRWDPTMADCEASEESDTDNDGESSAL